MKVKGLLDKLSDAMASLMHVSNIKGSLRLLEKLFSELYATRCIYAAKSLQNLR